MSKRGPQSHFILGAGVRVLHAWPEPEPGPVDLSPDGASLVYGPKYGRALVCREVESGRERWRSALSGSVTSLRYSPDGARLTANTLLGHVAVLDAETGRVLREHRVSDAPRGRVCWSPDGSRALSTHGHGEAEISLIDRDGGPLRTLPMPMRVGVAAFVSDEQIIVTGFQQRILLLDLRTREVVGLMFPGASFSSNSRNAAPERRASRSGSCSSSPRSSRSCGPPSRAPVQSPPARRPPPGRRRQLHNLLPLPSLCTAFLLLFVRVRPQLLEFGRLPPLRNAEPAE